MLNNDVSRFLRAFDPDIAKVMRMTAAILLGMMVGLAVMAATALI